MLLMRIEEDVKLDFCDVLLKPKRSTTIKRRSDVSPIRVFSFKYSPTEWTGVPIISSNMTSVTTSRVPAVMRKHNMLACMPKNYGPLRFDPHLIESVGLGDKPQSSDLFWLCLDAPNGYIQAVAERTKELRELYPEVILIVGNVVTGSMVEALILAGADIVKVGIGSGAACSTRIKTGVGMPQLSAVIECADAAHGLGGHIISDGGCSTPADIVKAFSGGADFVMLGGMLAGHDENGRDFYGMSSERANNESAGGLKGYRTSEGWEMKIPNRGPLEKTLQDILGSLRSACSYIGARSIEEMPDRATFIRVNRQANQSLWGYRMDNEKES